MFTEKTQENDNLLGANIVASADPIHASTQYEY